MKRSFSKRVSLVFWFVGSCGAVLFACWWIVVIFYTRTVSSAVAAIVMVGLGVVAAREGFKIFKAERNSN
jgi:hypothetical protein